MFESPVLHYLGIGILFGFQSGIMPGALTAFLVSESIQHGRFAGMKVAMAPLITDPPFALLSFFCLSLLPDYGLGAISLIGAIIIFFLGCRCLTMEKEAFQNEKKEGQTFRKAILVNLFNPNLYICWFTVLGVIMMEAFNSTETIERYFAVWTFLIGFFATLVFVNCAYANVVGASRKMLDVKKILWINRILGGVMFLFAIRFAYQGLGYFFGWNAS